jgi:hypothetical protein
MNAKTLAQLTLILLAAAFALPAHAEPDKAKLAEIDRTFTCPETLADGAAKQTALKQFVSQVGAAWPEVTIEQFTSFRMTLLEKHGCTQTLETIRQRNQDAGKAPG